MSLKLFKSIRLTKTPTSGREWSISMDKVENCGFIRFEMMMALFIDNKILVTKLSKSIKEETID